MTGNRSLDEFLGGAVDGEASGDADDGPDPGAVDAEPTGGADASGRPSDDRVEERVGEREEEREEEQAGEREGEGAEVQVGEREGEGADDAPVDPAVVEPMAPTYAWLADGGACAACGASAEVRWRDDVGLVCPDCKAW